MNRIVISMAMMSCVNMSALAQSYKLSGHVYSQGKTLPISYASIRNDNTGNAVLSDSVGHFEIQVNGTDSLTCSYIGCSNEVVPVANRKVVDIYLSDASLTLNGVEIVGKRKPVQMTVDGFVVNVDVIRKDGKMLSDIISQLPLVNVKGNVISMAGKSSVIVYLNNHKVYLNGENLVAYLNSLGLENIREIKVLPTPSTKYEADENIGIIAIETKKKTNSGLQSNFLGRGTIGRYLSYGGSAKVLYTGSKVCFETVVLGSRANGFTHSRYANDFGNYLVSTDCPQKSTEKMVMALSTLNYDINKRNRISATLQLPLLNRTKNRDIANDTRYLTMDNRVDSLMSSKGQGHSSDYQTNLEVCYACDFSKNSNFNMTFGYVNGYEKNYRDWLSVTKSQSASNNETFYSAGHQNNNIYTFKLDFENALGKWALGEGYKLSYAHTTSYNEEDKRLVADASSTNMFGYREYINAFYVNAKRSLGSFLLNMGIRAELTKTKGISYALNDINHNHYFRLFPNVGVKYSIDDENALNLNYSGRVKRPGFRLLDPFRWYISKYDYSEGNPFLRPSYIHNASLTYMHGSSLYTEMYFTHTKNDFGKMVILNSDNVQSQIERAGNFLNISAWGANMEYNWQLGSWLESNFSGDVTYSRYISHQPAFKNAAGWGGVFSLNNTFYLSKKVSSSLYVEDDIPGYYNYRKKKNLLLVNIGFAYTDKKRGLMVSLKAEDLFKNANPKYIYYSNGVRQEFNNYYDTRRIELTVVKKLGTMHGTRKLSFQSSNSEERSRL